MAIVELSLGDLFEQVHGYRSPAFQTGGQDYKFTLNTADDGTASKEQGFKPSFKAVPGRTERGKIAGSPYYNRQGAVNGEEYYLPIEVSYPDANGALQRMWLPYPVISIQSRKTIVETALTERRGMVAEIINIQGYRITVKGFIIAATNDFPEDLVTQLREVYEANQAISISNPVTDIFLLGPNRTGSDKVVIHSLDFPPVTGIKHVRPYVLELMSDEIFNLEDIGT